jgi:sugar/nucleoside kinase (ribokinase family)
MHTYLGACAGLTAADVDGRLVGEAAVTYVEGYLWDSPAMQAAVLKAAAAAHAAGRRFSLTLSDSFWVDRHRASFRDLVDGPIDILFGNEVEVMALYQVATLAEALAAVRGRCEIAVVTRSEKGSIILSGEETVEVEAEPVARLVDTTGAGDLYAAGFLYGLTAGRPLAECGLLGSIAAAEVIGHFGARPEADLAALAAARLARPATSPTTPR